MNITINPIISIDEMKKVSKQAKASILTMTTLAGSGHPGGSMSSLDLLIALYHCINNDPKEPLKLDRDKVIVSHGHISPAVYSVLGMRGYFDIEEAIIQFRLVGSIYEGHIELGVPGIEWATGNLGQGLSAACGFALESRLRSIDNQIYCLMGDGEQQKGQISEARRFAVKYKLNNVTAIVDLNKLQICGDIADVMPQNIKENYESDGWVVLEIDGHDFNQIITALDKAMTIDSPVLILANTVMGNGVSFMEHKEKYHGSALNEDDLYKAYEELGISLPYGEYVVSRKERKGFAKDAKERDNSPFSFFINKEKVYDKPTDNRSAWGDALADIAKLNKLEISDEKLEMNDGENKGNILAVFDCDLKGSVKTADFEKVLPNNFFQSGIMEHHTAVCAGALSKNNIQTFFADFGVFGIDEIYNQLRLNDINQANLKVVLTHVGLDVGEDGKTHQCIDYIGLVNNMFGLKLIIPADPNQTYKAINYVANRDGNYLIPMGRSKLDIIHKTSGDIFFDKNYEYQYGQSDILREGDQACMFVTGTLTNNAIKAVDLLKKENINIRLVNISSPLEIPSETIISATKTGTIFTLEDHNIKTGLGALIAQRMIEEQVLCPLIKFGVDNYSCSGSAEDVYKQMGLDVESLISKIKKAIMV